MRPIQTIPFEAPWLAIKADGKLHISDKAGYDQWLNQSLGDGERAMVLVLPLIADTPGYHAAAFRYYRSTVLPIVAEDLGESNLEDAHDTLVRQFLPLKAVPAKRGRGLKVQRKSTGMESMDCAEFCDYLDRLITWATHPDGRNLTIPMSDRRWKWRRQQEAGADALETRAGDGRHGPSADGSSVDPNLALDGTEPSAASVAGE